ncbi:hypothetical protein D3C83_213860 [compost metagenome]
MVAHVHEHGVGALRAGQPDALGKFQQFHLGGLGHAFDQLQFRGDGRQRFQ